MTYLLCFYINSTSHFTSFSVKEQQTSQERLVCSSIITWRFKILSRHVPLLHFAVSSTNLWLYKNNITLWLKISSQYVLLLSVSTTNLWLYKNNITSWLKISSQYVLLLSVSSTNLWLYKNKFILRFDILSRYIFLFHFTVSSTILCM